MNYNIKNVINELISVSDNRRLLVNLPDDDLIEEYQKEIKLIFNDDYKYYLKHANNIMYNLDEIVLVSNRNENKISELKTVLKEARNVGVDKSWIPICEDNGNYFCLTPEGSVKYYDLNGQSNEVWESIAFWIKDIWIDGN